MDQAPIAWRKMGECQKLEVKEAYEIFFPASELHDSEPAKVICRRCTVRAECLDVAIGCDEEAGIWGALNRAERVSLVIEWKKEGIPIPVYFKVNLRDLVDR